MKGKIPALAKRSLALALALALLLSLCPVIPLTADAAEWVTGSKYRFLQGAFETEDADLVYEGDQPYDWKVTVTQEQVDTLVDVRITITDADGNVVGGAPVILDDVAANKGTSVMCSAADYPALTTDLLGTFTMVCDIYSSNRSTPYAQMTETFSRVAESAEPEETTEAPEETTEVPEETTEAPEETTVATEPGAGEGEVETADPNAAYIKAELVEGVEGVVQHNAVAGAVNFSSGSFANIVYEIIDGEVYFKTSKWQSIGMQLPAAFLEGFDGNATVTFEYLEMGACDADFLYDAVGNNKKAHSTKIVADGSNSGELKTATYELTDAVFANLYGKGIAFALKVNSPAADSVIYIKSVTVTKAAQETPDEPDTPDTPDVPGSSVTTAKAYLDLMQTEVMENITEIAGLNMGTNPPSPITVSPAKKDDNVAWNLGPVALRFTLSEEFLQDFDGNVKITVEYFDVSTGTASLVYHSTSSTETVHPATMAPAGKNDFSVQTAVFELTDAVFTNLYEKGSSFAILGLGGGRFYLKSVTVEKPGAEEPGNTYTVELNSDVADLVFYDETPFDLTLDATTDGNIEVVTATYTLTGGNLAEALTETKTVTLNKEGVNVLDAAWFTEKAIGFGDFVLEVTLANEETELVKKTFNFSRKMTSILASELKSETAENKNGVLVFEEDAAMDLELFLKNKLSEAFSGTLTYTVSCNGTAMEGFTGLTLNIENLSGDASEMEGVLLPEATAYGIYELAISVKDGEGNEVHNKIFTFARAKNEFASSFLSSATNETLVFVDDAPYDMMLNVQKTDGYDEKLDFVWGIFSGEQLLKSGKFSKVISATAATPVQPDWSSAVGFGTFTLKLQVTNTLGYQQLLEMDFSRVESVKVELTSATNPDLIFNDDEAYDLQLSLQKLLGEDGVYTVNYTVANGETVVKTGSIADVSVTAEANVQALDMTGVEGNGVFTITVTLADAEGNAVKTVEFKVTRAASMEAKVLFAGNEDGIELPTFIDLVTAQAAVSLKKPVGEAEQFTVNYTVTDKDGNEVVANTTTATVGTTAVNAILDLSLVNEFGTYTVNATVVDAAGNEVATASADFARVEIVTTALTSSTNSDLVFTQGEAWDMVLHLKHAGTPEAFKAIIVIADKDGNKLIEKNTSIPATEYIKVTLGDLVDLSKLPETGAFTLSLKVGDAQNRLREDAVFAFSRVALEGSVEAAIKSPTTSNLVYATGSELDMQLYVQKTDNIAEGFTALLTITDKDGNEKAKLEAPLTAFVSRKFALKDLVDLSAITDAGAYNIYVKLTDNSGNTRHESNTTFTIVSLEGSVEAAVTSSSNPDLIFTEGEEFDLVLHMRKTDGIAEAFKAVITITDKDGNVLKEKEADVPARESLKTSVNDLIDLSDLPATGSFNLNMVLTDAAGNERLTLNQPFHRVKLASLKTQVSSNSNKDMIFTDKDTVDLMLYAQKTDDVAEELIIYYSVLNTDGEEIATAEGKTVVPAGSSYFKLPIEINAEDVAAHGFYKVILMVMDNNGNIRSETETKFARISGSGIKHQVSGSSTGTKMQFTPGMKIDLCLFAQKTDGVPESVQANLYVTSPSGQVIHSITGKLNIPATGYFKYALPLDGKCSEFGTYKVTYTFHDDAGTLRVSNVASFKVISPTGDLAVAVQSASGKPGMIYGKDDPFDLALYIQKADGVEQTLQVRYTISDMNGLVLETKQGKVNAPATGYRKLPIELPDIDAFDKYGIFTMKVEIAGPTGQMLYNEEFSFSRVLTPEKPLDVMGVCTHLAKKGMSGKQSQQYVDLARQAGASFWRDELPWSTVEPAKGTYYIPAVCDSAVDYTLSIGLEPLFILDYGNSNYGSDVTTDEWLEGYLGYVEHVVTHFKGRIKYYEVWNEWNIGLGGLDKKYRDFPDLYARILIPTYKLIKEIDPSITVIGGVVAGGDEEWIEELLKCEGAIESMDAFSFHDYPDNDIKEIQEQTQKVRDLMVKYGRPDMPLWLTETGWPTHIGRNSFTEEVSAGNLVSMFTWALANPGVLDQIFWYDLHNDGTEIENTEHNFGLLHNWKVDENTVPMAAKRSYVAMNAVCAILADAEFVGMYDLGHKKITAYHFKKDGKDMLVTWADDVTLNMVANIGDNNIIVTDMYGNASALTPVDGKVSLFFSDAPIYIEYDLTNKLELVEGGFTLDKQQYSATPAATFPVQITRNNGLESYSGSYAFSMPEGWSVEGIEFGAAEAGATEITDTVYVTVSDDATKGESALSVRVISDGNIMGQFTVPIEMGEICTVNPDVVFTDDGAEFKLSVQIINENSNKPLSGTINLLAPEALLGEASSVPFEIPAGENKAVLIDVPAEMANTYHTVKVEVVLGGGAKHEVTKPVSFLYAIEAPENMKLDGVIDDQWADAMEFTIGEDDWFNDVSSDAEWPGNTAKGYAMWDNEYLYVAVEAYDESHYQEASGASIWMYDSVQMATDISRSTVPGYYGFNEVGYSLSTDGSTIENWNWFAAPGKNVSEGGIFKIVRDETTKTTTYEVAVPWAELLPKGVEFDFKNIGFSLLVNENSIDEDGEATGRTGWIEYMSGVGYRKDVTLFGDLILAKRPEK